MNECGEDAVDRADLVLDFHVEQWKSKLLVFVKVKTVFLENIKV